MVYLTAGFCSFLIRYSVSSLKSAVFDSPKVEETMLDSLELLAPMSDVKSIFSNLLIEEKDVSAELKKKNTRFTYEIRWNY